MVRSGTADLRPGPQATLRQQEVQNIKQTILSGGLITLTLNPISLESVEEQPWRRLRALRLSSQPDKRCNGKVPKTQHPCMGSSVIQVVAKPTASSQDLADRNYRFEQSPSDCQTLGLVSPASKDGKDDFLTGIQTYDHAVFAARRGFSQRPGCPAGITKGSILGDQI